MSFEVQIQETNQVTYPLFSVDMNQVASIVLGGGQGTRLHPLTATCCKPAVMFGGRYRLIDIPISNSINSGIRKIFVLTQYLSSSLHQHLMRIYQFDSFSSGFFEILAAQQKFASSSWYQGTADAVRQNIDRLIQAPVDYFLILSGDQLYNINFQPMIQMAKRTDADLIIASTPVCKKDAKRMGLLHINEEGCIIDFVEKPQNENTLNEFRVNLKTIASMGITRHREHNYLASMGIYIFKRNALIKLLQEDTRHDFGKHLIPSKIKDGSVFAYLYNGYWEDIGTVEAYYNANLALTKPNPKLRYYDDSSLIFYRHQSLPPAKITANVKNAIICEGAIVEAKEISNSIIGMRAVIKHGTVIKDSILLGNDFYEHPSINNENNGFSSLKVGSNCLIKKSIIDKNVSIGNNVKLLNKYKLDTYNSPDIYIRDGVIIIAPGAKIPSDFVI